MSQHNRGFRNFMMDPKASVMTYLAENLPSDHRHQGQAPSDQHSGINVPLNSQTQQGQSQSSYNLQPIPQPNGASTQLMPQQIHTPPQQNGQWSTVQPYVAANLSRPSTPSMQQNIAHQTQNSVPSGLSQASTQSSIHGLSYPETVHQSLAAQLPSQAPLNNDVAQSQANMGINPLPLGARKKSSPRSVNRLYHHFVLNYEEMCIDFFSAKSGNDNQKMVALAYELESLAHRIWSLRYEHLSEFDAYSETAHQAIITHWQAQYDLWADTVADIQEEERDFVQTNNGKMQVAPPLKTAYQHTTSYEAPHLPYPSPNNTTPHLLPMQMPSTQTQQQSFQDQVSSVGTFPGQVTSEEHLQQSMLQTSPMIVPAGSPPLQQIAQRQGTPQQQPQPPSQNHQQSYMKMAPQSMPPPSRLTPNGPNGQAPPPGAWPPLKNGQPTGPLPPQRQSQSGPSLNHNSEPQLTQGHHSQQRRNSNEQAQLVAGMQQMHIPSAQTAGAVGGVSGARSR